MIRALIIFLLSGLIAVRPPYKNALTLTKIKKIIFIDFFDLPKTASRRKRSFSSSIVTLGAYAPSTRQRGRGRSGSFLLFLDALVFLYGFGRDSGGVSAGGVGLLDVGSRGGDSTPRFA